MEQRRGRGRSRGRASDQGNGGQRPGGNGQYHQGGGGGGGSWQGAATRGGRGAAPRPGPADWPTLGGGNGGGQPSAWGPPRQHQQPPQQQQYQQPPRQQYHQQPPHQQQQQRGPPRQPEQQRQPMETGYGGAGDAPPRSAPMARGAARTGGRRNELQDIIHTRPDMPSKQGKSGARVRLLANYVRLMSEGTVFLLYQYRVDFNPEVDDIFVKKRMVHTALRELVSGYLFDGTVLYIRKKLANEPLEKTVLGPNEEKHQVTFRLVGDVMKTDKHYLMVFNIIIRKCIAALKLQLISRNYFDPRAKIDIPNFKLQLWPGYITSIKQQETQIMMNVEMTYKVMRTDTCLTLLQDTRSRLAQNYKEEFSRRVVGSTVMTKYNNRFYRIDDVDWEKNPNYTFKLADGSSKTLVQYYKERYNQNVSITDQPLLVSRAKKRELRAGAQEMVYLIPEFCCLTGLTEADRANFPLMKAMAEYTRIGPENRIKRLQDFIRRLKSCPEAINELKTWDMNFHDQLVQLEGRILPRQGLKAGGNNNTIEVDQNADWTRSIRSLPMFTMGRLDRFLVFTINRFGQSTNRFVGQIIQAARGMGWNIPQPMLRELTNDSPAQYSNAIDEAVHRGRPSLILCVVSNNKSDRYSAIKKKCSVQLGIPSQVVVAKNLDSKGAMTIATKIAIQMNCKLGGSPWQVVIPAKALMVCGYDACHDPQDKSKTSGAIVTSMDPRNTRFYSQVSRHSSGEELSNDLSLRMVTALNVYRRENKMLPEVIVFYRDGVGEGQLNYVVEHEVQNLITTLKRDVYKEQPVKLAYIIVSKRINTRIFLADNRGNPQPGTIVDDVITLPERYDFFLVSQCVRQGTVSPTNYNVIHNTTGYSPDIIQTLTYKMTHSYYNWSGTVRVPAPCQYAHKLAFLCSQVLHREPHADLNSVLHYL